MATDAEILTAIKAAILSIIEGNAVQEYSMTSNMVKRYSLRELEDMRDRYEDRVGAAAGPIENVTGFVEPT